MHKPRAFFFLLCLQIHVPNHFQECVCVCSFFAWFSETQVVDTADALHDEVTMVVSIKNIFQFGSGWAMDENGFFFLYIFFLSILFSLTRESIFHFYTSILLITS